MKQGIGTMQKFQRVRNRNARPIRPGTMVHCQMIIDYRRPSPNPTSVLTDHRLPLVAAEGLGEVFAVLHDAIHAEASG